MTAYAPPAGTTHRDVLLESALTHLQRGDRDLAIADLAYAVYITATKREDVDDLDALLAQVTDLINAGLGSS